MTRTDCTKQTCLTAPQHRLLLGLSIPATMATSLRQRYRGQFLDMCRTLADLHVAGSDGAYVERAVDLYRRLVQVDPLDERTWRALLSAHAKRRDMTALGREWHD